MLKAPACAIMARLLTSGMQPVIDFLPVVLFGIAYYLYGIHTATATLMVAMTVMIALQMMLGRKIQPMIWTSYFLVLVFGGLTLALQNVLFIQWKPTILHWAMALVLLGGTLIGKRNLLARLFSGLDFYLPSAVWRNLSLWWAFGMFLKGALNLYFAFWQSEAVWVSFKLFGQTALTIVFIVATLVYLRPFLMTNEEGDSPARNDSE